MTSAFLFVRRCGQDSSNYQKIESPAMMNAYHAGAFTCNSVSLKNTMLSATGR